MSFMFEVYYGAPPDALRESRISKAVRAFGGLLDFREEPLPDDIAQTVCLTFEFEDCDCAEQAADHIRSLGEHVEGPMDY